MSIKDQRIRNRHRINKLRKKIFLAEMIVKILEGF